LFVPLPGQVGMALGAAGGADLGIAHGVARGAATVDRGLVVLDRGRGRRGMVRPALVGVAA
jgi:hypothetical protein